MKKKKKMKFNIDNKLVDYKRILGVILYDKTKLIKMKKEKKWYIFEDFLLLNIFFKVQIYNFRNEFFFCRLVKMLMSYKNVLECFDIFFYIY